MKIRGTGKGRPCEIKVTKHSPPREPPPAGEPMELEPVPPIARKSLEAELSELTSEENLRAASPDARYILQRLDRIRVTDTHRYFHIHYYPGRRYVPGEEISVTSLILGKTVQVLGKAGGRAEEGEPPEETVEQLQNKIQFARALLEAK